MCSGCSGNYDGGFDFEDCGDSPGFAGENDSPAGTWRVPEERGRRPSAGGSGRFEVHAVPKANSELADLPGVGNERGGEICEIMVSATRIVEIRVISAQGGEIKGLGCAEGAERPAVRKHSTMESAKYYRTRGNEAERHSDRVQMSCFRGLAAVAASHFKRWVRWVRGGNRGTKNSLSELTAVWEGTWTRKD